MVSERIVQTRGKQTCMHVREREQKKFHVVVIVTPQHMEMRTSSILTRHPIHVAMYPPFRSLPPAPLRVRNCNESPHINN